MQQHKHIESTFRDWNCIATDFNLFLDIYTKVGRETEDIDSLRCNHPHFSTELSFLFLEISVYIAILHPNGISKYKFT